MRIKKKIVLTLIGLTWLSVISGCSANKTQETAVPEKAVPVNVIHVKNDEIFQEYSFSGKVNAVGEVNIVAKAPGRVEQVLVDLDDSVKAGDILVRLDSKEIQAQVKQAEAALATAKANLAKIQAGARSQEKEQAKLAVSQAEANFNNAKANYERMQNLFNQGALSSQQLDGARLQYQVAEAQFKSAQQQVDMIESGATKETLDMARAQVQQAAAAVELARSQLDNTIITSPISGKVSMRNINPGEMAITGVPLLTVVTEDKLTVEGTVAERVVNQIKEGQKVKVVVNAISNEAIEGTVNRISPSTDMRTKAFPVEIKIENENGLIRPGMFAEIHIKLASKENVLVLPRQALVNRDGKTQVFKVEGNRAKLSSITVGLEDTTLVEIIDGLKEGDGIVITGQRELKDGTLITPKDTTEKKNIQD